MPATLVQSTSNTVSSGTSVSVILGTGGTNIPVTAGNRIVAYVGSATTGRTCSASDNVNGAYNTDVAAVSSCSICSFANTAGGTITVSGAISGGATRIILIVEEWSGTVTTTGADKTASNNGASNTTGTTGTTATLSQADEVQLALMQLNSVTATSPTPFAVASPFTASPASPAFSGAIEMAAGNNQPLSTTGVSATFNWTTANTWRGCIASYACSIGQPPLTSAFIAVLP